MSVLMKGIDVANAMKEELIKETDREIEDTILKVMWAILS